MTNLEVLRMNLCFKRSKLCNPPTSSHHQTCYAFHTFLFFLQLLFSLVGIRNLSKVSMQFRAIRNLIEFYKDTYIYDKIDLFFQPSQIGLFDSITWKAFSIFQAHFTSFTRATFGPIS